MKYYGIYTNTQYKVAKRTTSMVNNRDWLKKHYGRTAIAYRGITVFEYLFYKMLGREIKEKA